jgi:hypothetical protein
MHLELIYYAFGRDLLRSISNLVIKPIYLPNFKVEKLFTRICAKHTLYQIKKKIAYPSMHVYTKLASAQVYNITDH